MGNTTGFIVKQTPIPGLLEIDIPKIEDERGWFQEKFQQEKLVAAGFPKDFKPVQQNISFNKEAGVLRGIHAEPWDKYVTVISGKVFAFYVDLRKENFGGKYAVVIDHAKAVFVPRGVANSFQTLESGSYYSYLVNDHWKPDGIYKSVNVSDPSLGVTWPIPLEQSIVSEKDRKSPLLQEMEPF